MREVIVKRVPSSGESIESHKSLCIVSLQVLPICGGLSKNELFVQTHADVLGLPVVLPETTESVLLGSAILAATAASAVKEGAESTITDIMTSMGGGGKEVLPRPEVESFHRAKYNAFQKLLACQMDCADIMAQWTVGKN